VPVEEEKPVEAPKESDNVLDLLHVDPMELEIGYGLIPLVDASRGGNLLQRITLIRRQLATELGIILPTIRVRDNLQLRPSAYSVKLRGVEIARGELMVNHFLAMNPGGVEDVLSGIPTTEPAFGLPAQWVPTAQRERAEMLGFTVVDTTSVLTTHLTEVIKVHAPSILGRQAAQTLMDNLKHEHPALVDELIPGLLTLGEVQKVLQNLLRERLSIRDLVTILETLADRARATRDTDLLSEHVRHALQRSISAQFKDDNDTIYALLLSPRLEEMLASSLQPTEQGVMINVDPNVGQRLLQRLARESEKMASVGFQPVVLCSSRIRLPLRRFTERALRNLSVLSFGEVAPQVEVRSQGMVALEEA
jgi:flagellar biosynthesis protein FlhA